MKVGPGGGAVWAVSCGTTKVWHFRHAVEHRQPPVDRGRRDASFRHKPPPERVLKRAHAPVIGQHRLAVRRPSWRVTLVLEPLLHKLCPYSAHQLLALCERPLRPVMASERTRRYGALQVYLSYRRGHGVVWGGVLRIGACRQAYGRHTCFAFPPLGICHGLPGPARISVWLRLVGILTDPRMGRPGAKHVYRARAPQKWWTYIFEFDNFAFQVPTP